jgi:hypothetical protein
MRCSDSLKPLNQPTNGDSMGLSISRRSSLRIGVSGAAGRRQMGMTALVAACAMCQLLVADHTVRSVMLRTLRPSVCERQHTSNKLVLGPAGSPRDAVIHREPPPNGGAASVPSVKATACRIAGRGRPIPNSQSLRYPSPEGNSDTRADWAVHLAHRFPTA